MNLAYTDVRAKLLKDEMSIYMLQIIHFSLGIYNYIPLIPHDYYEYECARLYSQYIIYG